MLIILNLFAILYAAKAGVCAKRKRLDITSCSVQDSELVHQSLVQIAAEEQEIQRRIRCFVEKKRGVIDISNILDFTMIKRLPNYNYATDDAVELSEESTCARTNSAIVKQEHSKCHLRVRRVENRIGPQTRPDYMQALDNLMFLDSHQNKHRIKNEPRAHYGTITNKFKASSSALQERLIDIGEHLGIVNVPVENQKQMYMLLKDMENRILHLESISPEYKNFSQERTDVPSKFIGPQIGTPQGASGNEYSMVKHKVYTVEDIESIIEEIEQTNDDSDKEQLEELTLSTMS